MKKDFIRIGIDPDIDKSGVAMLVRSPFGKPKIMALDTMTFFKLTQFIKSNNSGAITCNDDIVVCIEAGWLNKVSNYHSAINKQVAGRIGKNVGENHAVGKLIELFCKENNIPYKLIKPCSSKWDADLFKKITGYVGRTNSEMRDAVRAAWI